MKIKNLYFLFFLSIFLSCRKDKPVIDNSTVTTTFNEKVWISNEGNFQFGNGELSLYNAENNEVINKFYESVNQKKLGDVFQS
ncbi:MAG: hypothetical protein KA275_09320, partial [Chitinophagaceae bacterium]|nr:hypothetical protein [Chitinophagaceae bacterium]